MSSPDYVELRAMAEPIAEELDLGRATVEAVLARAVEAMTEALAAGQDVRVRGFGIFEVRDMPPVVRQVPGRGAVPVPSRRKAAFHPSRTLKAAMNP